MKVFWCTNFTGFWPVGTAAVVVAEDYEQALSLLNSELQAIGLKGDATIDDLKLIALDVERALILNDGNY